MKIINEGYLYHKFDELMVLRSCIYLTSWPIKLGKDAYYVHLLLSIY